MKRLTPEEAAQVTAKVQAETACAFAVAFPDCRIVEKIECLLDAKKTVSCVGGKDAGAVTVDFVDVDDYRVQLDAVKLVCDLRGLLRKKVELSGPGGKPLAYDDIPAEERRLLLAVTRDYERRLNEKSAKLGKAAGKKGRRTRQD